MYYDARTNAVLIGMAILFVCAWAFSLAPLLGVHFYDSQYAQERIHAAEPDVIFGNSTAFQDIASTYYAKQRYVYFLPHVVAAVVWWNFYFFQLVGPLRRQFPVVHRYMGRLLLVVALLQVISGCGLAFTTHSPIIAMVSFVLAVAVLYCIVRAWTFARKGDYVRHKYWAWRLVGYLQTIALQRFYIVTLILSHSWGWYALFPSFQDKPPDQVTAIILQIFDGSFVMAILTALLVTEWYLAAQQGMMDPSSSSVTSDDVTSLKRQEGLPQPADHHPLVETQQLLTQESKPTPTYL